MTELSPAARDALATAEPDRTASGTWVVKLRCGHISDRKIYEEVATALQRIGQGGKWNRSQQGFVYRNGDPGAELDVLKEHGRMPPDPDRQAGFVRTPRPLAERMLTLADELVAPGCVALEPSAGDGAIATVMRDRGVEPVCVESDAYRAGLLRAGGYETYQEDFLAWAKACRRGFRLIVANPPFHTPASKTEWIDHVHAMLRLLEPGGMLVAVAPDGLTFRTDSRHVAVRQLVKSLGGGWERLPEGTFKESGTNINACLLWARTPTRPVVDTDDQNR